MGIGSKSALVQNDSLGFSFTSALVLPAEPRHPQEGSSECEAGGLGAKPIAEQIVVRSKRRIIVGLNNHYSRQTGMAQVRLGLELVG